MITRYIIMRTISKSFEIILFLLLVLVPCSVLADDFEDDFIDNVEFYEQADEVNNQSDEDLRGLTPESDLDESVDQSSEPTKEEDQSGAPDPEGFRNSSQDLEPDNNGSEEESKKAGDEGDSDNNEVLSESPDYSEDIKVIINLLQNVQLTMMIVCGIIIGFFFITRLLP